MAKIICSKCGKELMGDYPICPYCRTPRATQTPWEAQKQSAQTAQKKKKSALLLISAILGVLYAIYSIAYWMGTSDGMSGAAAVGAGIATVLTMPHTICAVLAAIFNVLGWAMSSRGFALTGAILYAVAAFLFPIYAMFDSNDLVLCWVREIEKIA